jgi:hypothetical protein
MEVVHIQIDIGIFPQSYVSDVPESGGFFNNVQQNGASLE